MVNRPCFRVSNTSKTFNTSIIKVSLKHDLGVLQVETTGCEIASQLFSRNFISNFDLSLG